MKIQTSHYSTVFFSFKMEGREISDTNPVSASCYLAYISVPNFIGKSVHIHVLCVPIAVHRLSVLQVRTHQFRFSFMAACLWRSSDGNGSHASSSQMWKTGARVVSATRKSMIKTNRLVHQTPAHVHCVL